MEENIKISKILSEFCLYLLENGIDVLSMKVKKNKSRVAFIFECDLLPKEILEELDEIFKFKRQQSYEVYGWELIGHGDMDHELTLVSTLINYFTYYIKDERVFFCLVRYEED